MKRSDESKEKNIEFLYLELGSMAITSMSYGVEIQVQNIKAGITSGTCTEGKSYEETYETESEYKGTGLENY